MFVVVDRVNNLVSVDGIAVQLDLADLPPGLTAIVWTGREGWTETAGRRQPLAGLDDWAGLLDRHAAAVAQVAPSTSWTVDQAVERTLALIVAESQRRQHALIEVEGILYYADAWATATVEAALAAAQALGLADTDPVRVPPPLQPGWWLSASLDEGGNRVAVPMTVGGIKGLVVALYDRNGLIWGAEMVHKATIEAMAATGATAEQILGYDHTAGWPTT